MENIEEKKKKVINEFINTRKHIRTIARENNLSLEEVYVILKEYNASNELVRPETKISFPSMQKYETDEGKRRLYEKIYELRKQKKTYQTISEETGLTIGSIRSICVKMFVGKKGEQIPKASYKKTQTEESKEIDEIIYSLVQQGKRYREIREELNDIGISMSTERIRQRCERRVLQDKKELAKTILSLMTTRKATMEQIKQMADYYGVDLEETMNSLEER